MWERIPLRTRIYIILTALVMISLIGGVVTVWYTYRLEGLLTQVIDRHVAAYQAAEALETALVNQKGFVSYYFLDGDPDWLRQLGKYRQVFEERLEESRTLINSQRQKEIIDRIESRYRDYTAAKDRVIALYKAGNREQGSRLHREVRESFFEILDLCRRYKSLNTQRIAEARSHSYSEASRLRMIAVTGMFTAFFLGLLLAFVLAHQILGPVRRLAAEAGREGGDPLPSRDEVQNLSRSVRGLIEEYDHTHSELEKSRETLLQAEKMVLVGKLAAGVAHSIRNPLTSVSMRLFSLGRTLQLEGPQKEDFDVIAEETRHIDTIVQNFLEFSRRPKLRPQLVNPSDLVDMTLQLLHHRLKSYEVDIRVERDVTPLPLIHADPEQLKEVLVNLIVNACEAMGRGGAIVIREDAPEQPKAGRIVRIRVVDNGPGIPEALQDRILQPFFTTKDEGTGLGLSIATRILEEHGGFLGVESKEGEGTTFTVILPLGDIIHE
ncbi:MAG: MCP four helix bundle domain-containing protein [Deltaproteobacteria bacterium]|nr:MCP four helix bundle domain-containing protein [Deltaproteobacteria bacterium]